MPRRQGNLPLRPAHATILLAVQGRRMALRTLLMQLS